MRKIWIMTGLIIIAGIIVIAGGIWAKGKTDWYDSFGGFGTLNLIEGFGDEMVNSNTFSDVYYLDSIEDFRIEGEFTIKEGEVKVIVSLNGEFLFEKEMNSEIGRFESDIYTDKKGELQIDVIPSDDVDGEYTMTTYTRETNWNRLIRRIKDE